MTIVEKAAMQILIALVDAIKAGGTLGVPSGHLYAACMAKGCTIQQWEKIERTLINTGLVAKNGDLLTWKGDL